MMSLLRALLASVTANLRLYVYGALAVVALIAGLSIRQHYINVGWDKAMQAVAAKDAASIHNADTAERAVKDCYASGGHWNQGAMSCER